LRGQRRNRIGTPGGGVRKIIFFVAEGKTFITEEGKGNAQTMLVFRHGGGGAWVQNHTMKKMTTKTDKA